MPLLVIPLMFGAVAGAFYALMALQAGAYVKAAGLVLLGIVSWVAADHTRCPKCSRRPMEKGWDEGMSVPSDISDHCRHCGRYTLYIWPFQYLLAKEEP